jgi:hypothetical protein
MLKCDNSFLIDMHHSMSKNLVFESMITDMCKGYCMLWYLHAEVKLALRRLIVAEAYESRPISVLYLTPNIMMIKERPAHTYRIVSIPV